MRTHFSTREVARILKLSDGRLRTCLRAAVDPGRSRGNFTFQDLLLLRTTKELLDAQVPVGRIRRMLSSLKRQLPEDQQLWNVTIYADGRRVVVWDGTARWQPDSGQFLFDFEPRALARQLPLKTVSAPPLRSGRTAEDWFELACELDKHSPEEARHAYGQALELDPGYVAAHINLGRLYHEAKEYGPAEHCYRTALGLDPTEILAHYNLAVLLDETNQRDGAIAAYREALACDSSFSDAHYNLALLYEAQGRKSEAIRHFQAAHKLRRLSPKSPRRPFSGPPSTSA
jgi:tetratricopeptide (TPR) repeat protein